MHSRNIALRSAIYCAILLRVRYRGIGAILPRSAKSWQVWYYVAAHDWKAIELLGGAVFDPRYLELRAT